jgi:hypothetical protein
MAALFSKSKARRKDEVAVGCQKATPMDTFQPPEVFASVQFESEGGSMSVF